MNFGFLAIEVEIEDGGWREEDVDDCKDGNGFE
jgi:hypothetical protein